MTKPIFVAFGKGVQEPAKLGTLFLRLTAAGKAAFAQNIDASSDEFGENAIVPGPRLTNIGNMNQLTGVPIVKQFYGDNTPYGFLYFGEGALGALNKVRRIKLVVSGQTPIIDTTGSFTVSHLAHGSATILDMVLRPDGSANKKIFLLGRDGTDTFLSYFIADGGSPSLTAVGTQANFGTIDAFLILSSFDNNIYVVGLAQVDSLDVAETYTSAKLALGLPQGTYATCGCDWNQQMLVAYTTEPYGDFTRRKSASKSGIAIWDYVSPAITKNVPAPCRYISAVIPTPEGGVVVFGGVDEGKTSIYDFTGYGFKKIFSYIGDMPRSRHSVEFDSQGRILWQTVDGQICRLDRTNGKFDHLGTILTGSSAGGILARGIGTPTGNEFFAGSGSGTSYVLDIVSFGNYIGDASAEGITTPREVSGTQLVPDNTTISAITLHLNKSLVAGEKVTLELYANGSTTPTTYITMDASDVNDLGKSSKRVVLTVEGINNFSLGAAYKMADGQGTAPPVAGATVEFT